MKMAYIKMKKEKRERDNCVSCGEETEYYKDTHIDFRKHYIEGAGQLCSKCYGEIYGKQKVR